MILPYRLIESKLRQWRQKTYSPRQLVWLAVLLFLGSVMIGGVLHPVLAKPAYLFLLKPTTNALDALSMALGGLPLAISLAIFLKNAAAVLITIGFARRTRGISVALLLVVNGLMIGSVLTVSVLHHPLGVVAAGFLTHGILELAGVMLGASLGLGLLLSTEEQLLHWRRHSARTFALMVLPILFTAAVLEGHLTPVLLARLAGTM